MKKVANFVRITHRDEVEPPITDWLQEAYEWVEEKRKKPRVRRRRGRRERG